MTWSHSDSGTFQDRWDAAAAKMIEAWRRASLSGHQSISTTMRKWLEGQHAKQDWQPPSPAQKLADEEFHIALRRYDEITARIIKEQAALLKGSALKRAKGFGVGIDAKLLAAPPSRELMLDAFFAGALRPKPGGHRGQTAFSSPQQTRAASWKVLAYVQELQARYASLCDLAWLGETPRDLERVVISLVGRISALEQRCEELQRIALRNPQPEKENPMADKFPTTGSRTGRHRATTRIPDAARQPLAMVGHPPWTASASTRPRT